MSFNYSYQDAMSGLRDIAQSSEPAYVRVKALSVLARELSPANPNQRQNHLALGIEPHPEPEPTTDPSQPAWSPDDGLHFFTSEDELTDEDDDYP